VPELSVCQVQHALGFIFGSMCLVDQRSGLVKAVGGKMAVRLF
jgi:hypothetical protein